MTDALLIGNEPGWPLGYRYVKEKPYEAVVIGSLTIGELLHFSNEEVLSALAEGIPVILYTPGLPEVKANRSFVSNKFSTFQKSMRKDSCAST